PPAPAMTAPPGPDPDAALNRARAGAGRPDWVKELAELLPPLLTAPTAEERLAGALPLIPFGRDGPALPALLEAAKNTPNLRGKAAAALAWLPWEKRLALYRQLLEMHPTDEQIEDAVHALTRVRDPRTRPLLWELAGRERLSGDLAAALLYGLNTLQFGAGT